MTPTQYSILTIIREVAANAKPPQKQSSILKGEMLIDHYHLARLRGIACLRMHEAGISMEAICEVFKIERTALLHIFKRTPTLILTNPRYQQFGRDQPEQLL